MRRDFSIQDGMMVPVRHGNRTEYIPVADITHITCDSYMTSVFVLNNPGRYDGVKLLKRWEEELVPAGFARVSYNALVNGRYVNRVYVEKSRCMVRVEDVVLEVSRRKRKGLVNLVGGEFRVKERIDALLPDMEGIKANDNNDNCETEDGRGKM